MKQAGDIKKERNFKLKKYLAKYKGYLFFGPFFKALEAVTEVVVPFLMAIIIDKYIATGNKPGIIWLSVLILALNIIGVVFAVVWQKMASIAGEGIGRDIRNDIFKHINTFSFNELDKFTTTELLNRNVFDVLWFVFL